MSMRVLLVDDEPAALERLQALFLQIEDVTVVGAAINGREALAAIETLSPDLIMLDIQMPERSGLAVAAALPIDQRPEIVFVTAYEMYAPDAFEVEAADYLLKPVRFDRLRQAVERARRRLRLRQAAAAVTIGAPDEPETECFWVQSRGGHLRVPVRDIDWIEAARDYVLLHTSTRSHIYRTTMGALEKTLDPTRLMRVHRSAFVNPDQVQEVTRLGNGLISLVVKGGVSVSVGPTYARAVLERLGVS